MRIDPRQIEKAMKKMGMQATPIEAEEVIIKTADRDLVITNPQVTRVDMMGQQTFQIAGDVEERGREKFSEDDIVLVMQKTGASRADAKHALEKHGDIASAILSLKK